MILLNAIKQQLNQEPIHLHLYGNGPMESEIKKVIAQNDLQETCIVHGFCSNISQILNQYQILILPSKTESCSYTLLEGMANHVFLIASDCPGNREMIVDQITGALFHCDDSAQLAQSVRYWFSHTPERNAVAENAYNRARQYYSTKQMGDRFIELYQCVLNK